VRGEALRYLPELPFTPPAIAHNRELEWRELNATTAEVATTIGRERLVATLEIDGDGDIVQTSSEMRRFKIGTEWVPTPWGGRFADYKIFRGMRVASSRRGLLGTSRRPLRLLARHCHFSQPLDELVRSSD
jgi:hypothetical protein